MAKWGNRGVACLLLKDKLNVPKRKRVKMAAFSEENKLIYAAPGYLYKRKVSERRIIET